MLWGSMNWYQPIYLVIYIKLQLYEVPFGLYLPIFLQCDKKYQLSIINRYFPIILLAYKEVYIYICKNTSK